MPVEVQVKETVKDHPRIDRLRDLIEQRLEKIYRALDLTDPVVSLLLTDDEEIAGINEQWRGVEGPTDVLSFPAYRADAIPKDPAHLGDIVISVPYAQRLVTAKDHTRRVAQELGVEPGQLEWNLEEEVAFLFVHGLLHLMGYDHGTADEETQMRRMERQLWETLTH